MARSYQQYCGLARALDVVGERWTLLLVRELLVAPARYGELATALPGIASNLLAERLKALVSAGVVERRLHESGAAVYALTPWGEQLRGPVEGLVRWSAPLMAPGPGDDAFAPRWLLVGLRALLHDRRAEPPVEVGLHVAGALLRVRVEAEGAAVSEHVAERDGEAPATTFRAGPDVVLGLAAGALDVDAAVERGELRGSRSDLARALSALPAAASSR